MPDASLADIASEMRHHHHHHDLPKPNAFAMIFPSGGPDVQFLVQGDERPWHRIRTHTYTYTHTHTLTHTIRHTHLHIYAYTLSHTGLEDSSRKHNGADFRETDTYFQPPRDTRTSSNRSSAQVLPPIEYSEYKVRANKGQLSDLGEVFVCMFFLCVRDCVPVRALLLFVHSHQST